jgi:hypothetical protein
MDAGGRLHQPEQGFADRPLYFAPFCLRAMTGMNLHCHRG